MKWEHLIQEEFIRITAQEQVLISNSKHKMPIRARFKYDLMLASLKVYVYLLVELNSWNCGD